MISMIDLLASWRRNHAHPEFCLYLVIVNHAPCLFSSEPGHRIGFQPPPALLRKVVDLIVGTPPEYGAWRVANTGARLDEIPPYTPLRVEAMKLHDTVAAVQAFLASLSDAAFGPATATAILARLETMPMLGGADGRNPHGGYSFGNALLRQGHDSYAYAAVKHYDQPDLPPDIAPYHAAPAAAFLAWLARQSERSLFLASFPEPNAIHENQPCYTGLFQAIAALA